MTARRADTPGKAPVRTGQRGGSPRMASARRGGMGAAERRTAQQTDRRQQQPVKAKCRLRAGHTGNRAQAFFKAPDCCGWKAGRRRPKRRVRPRRGHGMPNHLGTLGRRRRGLLRKAPSKQQTRAAASLPRPSFFCFWFFPHRAAHASRRRAGRKAESLIRPQRCTRHRRWPAFRKRLCSHRPQSWCAHPRPGNPRG